MCTRSQWTNVNLCAGLPQVEAVARCGEAAAGGLLAVVRVELRRLI